ncbi:CopZ family metallochaperone [Deinococcus cellulosilyticus]|uniref:HMA domain-containing protein n=1 Tax=Deinococcus cellulosilyticus (strain DSM 18568 / NBRC 106333 / KACC 11606 / 5516J-15) TaxID=1223518 RepID=A0A511N9P0_DEIC1|nr:heavy metal-associated domain-containing protein [Deinococcus cellulosilyticus]GEM49549.1 hypothetical protein DC3_51840 [Deinococcus cellulosilyticus NBRC 106333 = KACC 11606]
MTVELNISGMSCGHCEKAVKSALKSVAGVENAEVNLQQGTATVEGNADVQALIQAVTEEGYGATVRN